MPIMAVIMLKTTMMMVTTMMEMKMMEMMEMTVMLVTHVSGLTAGFCRIIHSLLPHRSATPVRGHSTTEHQK